MDRYCVPLCLLLLFVLGFTSKVWTGLQTMCSAILDGCTCNGDTGPVTTVSGRQLETSTAGTATENVYETTFQLGAIESSGIMKDGSIDITAVYTSTGSDRVFTEWRLHRERFRETGLIRRNGTASIRPTDSGMQHTSSFKLVSPDNVRYFEFVLTAGKDEFNSVFNVSALYEEGVQNMNPLNATIAINSPGGKLVSPKTEDLRFNVTMHPGGWQPDDFEVQFMGVNTSAAVPLTFESFSREDDDVSFTLIDGLPESGKYVALVHLRNRVSRYGGILVVRIFRRQGGYIKGDGYAVIQDVFSTGSEDIVPMNKHGFFPFPKQKLAIAPEVSVVCAAMGNPQPHLTLTKSGKRTKTLEADLIYEASYLTVISYTMNTTDIEGKYICNLHDNNYTCVILSTVTYDLIMPKEFEFHEDKTGVTKNNSKKIMVLCKASGTPRPELGFSLYEEYGPDVARSGLYKVSRTYPSANTTTLQMTMSPVNRDITRLYCAAGHPDFDVKFYRVDIFPDSPEWQRNWELFEHIENMTRVDTL